MEVRVIGICGSPIKGGNTELLLDEALKAAAEADGVSTEKLILAGKDIRNCRHCNWCVTKQEEGKFCALKDDMEEMYPSILASDALLVATPVYFGRLSGLLANFLDRLRPLNEGKLHKRSFKNKVGGALSVAWFRNTGLETALLSIILGYFALRIIPVGTDYGGCQWGAVGLSTEMGTGKFDPADKHGILGDEYGLESAQNIGRRVAEVAKIVKAGQQALKTG